MNLAKVFFAVVLGLFSIWELNALVSKVKSGLPTDEYITDIAMGVLAATISAILFRNVLVKRDVDDEDHSTAESTSDSE